MNTRPTIVQVNLSPTLGGAEVYTAFMSRALAARGWPTRVLVNTRARFWRDLDFGSVEQVRVNDAVAAAAAVAAGEIALIHASLPAPLLSTLQERAPIVGVAHQAIYAGSRPAYYDSADLLLGVSKHVIKTLRDNGVANVHGEPLYGVGEIVRRHHDATPRSGPLCEWDEHKPRDRVLAFGEKVRSVFGSATTFARSCELTYSRRRGLTLGIVSRLAPLKQFPALFEILAPVIAAQPEVNLEIFGVAVGYKALREMRAALRPLGARARLWGHQRDVAPAYRGIDYLLTGLPEREALGLNVIESCLCGTPVLAVDAPPFTETMSDGVTGFLYTDPRRDRGQHFARILASLVDGSRKPDMARAPAHLELFSFARFADRVDGAMLDALSRAGHRIGSVPSTP
jgi:glycosyltransferase involved in cell wall biosynthesis